MYKLIYTDEIKAEINKLLKKDADDDINTVSLAEMKVVKSKENKGEEIAVYYAYGDIVDSEAGGLMSDGNRIRIGTNVALR